MSSDMKTVVLTKQAAADMMGGSVAPKKRNRSARKSQNTLEGGAPTVSSPASGPTTVIKLGHMGGELPPPPPMPSSSPSVKPNQVKNTETPVKLNVQEPTLQQSAGEHKVVKVELKKKVATKKVQLQPKKAEPPKATLHGKKTLKKPRKITLGISSMHRRLTRAKKAQTRVKEMPLDDLKKLLISKKLIKPTSTAPESILRQIAADAQIVADKAL